MGFRCKLGFHKWKEYTEYRGYHSQRRKCIECGLEQEWDEGTKIGLEDAWVDINSPTQQEDVRDEFTK